jgi:hypothetical protein
MKKNFKRRLNKCWFDWLVERNKPRALPAKNIWDTTKKPIRLFSFCFIFRFSKKWRIKSVVSTKIKWRSNHIERQIGNIFIDGEFKISELITR